MLAFAWCFRPDHCPDLWFTKGKKAAEKLCKVAELVATIESPATFYTQTEVVWDKKHCAMYERWRFGMLTHPKPLRDEYIPSNENGLRVKNLWLSVWESFALPNYLQVDTSCKH